MEITTVILISLIIGGVLGAVYFGGLWITINRFVNGEKHSHLMVITSFLLRAAFVSAGFYMLLQFTHQWQLLAVGLVGFVISRLVITKMVKTKSQTV